MSEIKRAIRIPAALVHDGTREQVEDWCITILDPQGLLNPRFEMDDDPSTVNIWGPTEMDFHCPLIATLNLFTFQLEVRI
jgi:hypothetical protein